MPTKAQLERSAPRDRGGDVHVRSRAQLLEYETAVARILADGPRELLDWGCGMGQLSDMLLRAGLDVTSMDWDPEAPEGEVRRLERFANVQARYTREPVQLPYEDASFDAVLSMGVLEHVHDPAGSLAEHHRVLRPGGLLYVYKLPNRYSYLEWIARRVGFYYHGQLENDTVYTVDEARALVARHGFEVIEARRANMLPLSLTPRWLQVFGPLIWWLNRALTHVPGLNRLATNVELVARRVP